MRPKTDYNYTARDIAKLLTWKEVKGALDYFYPSYKNNYKPVFDRVRGFRRRKQDNADERIVINCLMPQQWREDQTQEDLLEDKYYSIATNLYSMSFRKWYEISNILIEEETLDRYDFKEIVAHFLWEITFYGNEKDMTKRGKAIRKSANEVKKMSKEELDNLPKV